MSFTYIFKRTEKKYHITADEAEMLKSTLSDVLVPDEYGISTVSNLYLDTPDFLLIRNSIDAVSYKEKLRIRSSGTPDDSTTVFLEIKKKYKGVVYKRRISQQLCRITDYLTTGIPPADGQIMNEIDYAMNFYNHPQPCAALFYEREAYSWRGENGVRLTFDTNIRYRADDLKLQNGSHGTNIIPDGVVLLEVKCSGAMPLRLSHTLDKARIYPSRFSKYGTAYSDMMRMNRTSHPDELYSQLQSKETTP